MGSYKFKKEMIDPTTGEVIDVIAIVPEARDKLFVKIFPLLGEKVIEEMKIVNGEMKLFLWFLAKTIENPIQSEMWIPIDRKKVSEEIGISIDSVNKCLKKLLDMKYIEQYKKRTSVYRICPELVYKGSLVKYQHKETEKVFLK